MARFVLSISPPTQMLTKEQYCTSLVKLYGVVLKIFKFRLLFYCKICFHFRNADFYSRNTGKFWKKNVEKNVTKYETLSLYDLQNKDERGMLF